MYSKISPGLAAPPSNDMHSFSHASLLALSDATALTKH